MYTCALTLITKYRLNIFETSKTEANYIKYVNIHHIRSISVRFFPHYKFIAHIIYR